MGREEGGEDEVPAAMGASSVGEGAGSEDMAKSAKAATASSSSTITRIGSPTWD